MIQQEFPSALDLAHLRYLRWFKAAGPQVHLIKLCEWKEDVLDIQRMIEHFSSVLITASGMIIRGFASNPGPYRVCQSSHWSVWYWMRVEEKKTTGLRGCIIINYKLLCCSKIGSIIRVLSVSCSFYFFSNNVITFTHCDVRWKRIAQSNCLTTTLHWHLSFPSVSKI